MRQLFVKNPELHSAEPSNVDPSWCTPIDESMVPLVVPMDQKYEAKGNCVVSSRNMKNVGYNGFKFRNIKPCPELRNMSSKVVRRAWPKGFLEADRGSGSEEVAREELSKCAPLNWMVRRAVGHFCENELDWKARYPPMNMLNAAFNRGPRDSEQWIPTATYEEPPFPIVERTSAYMAMKRLAYEHSDIAKPIHILHALREVFREMGDRHDVKDVRLQRTATMPGRIALYRYKMEMEVYKKREKGHPKAPKTLRRVFRDDEKSINEVEKVLREKGVSGAAAKKLKEETFSKLYAEAEMTPGGLARFKGLVAKDHERYSRELNEFKEVQREFDMDHGLLTADSTQETHFS